MIVWTQSLTKYVLPEDKFILQSLNPYQFTEDKKVLFSSFEWKHGQIEDESTTEEKETLKKDFFFLLLRRNLFCVSTKALNV